MSQTRRLTSGAFYIMAGQGAGQLLGFARNFVVARLISPFDFGIAAAIAATLSVVELASDVAWDKLIIQAPDGDSVSVQAVCHLMMILRGAVLSFVLFLLAPTVAGFFDASAATQTFQCLALAPLVRGFSHLDIKRFQRTFNFRPDTDVAILSQAVSVLIAVLAAYWLRDYRAMLAAILAQALVLTLASHWRAERAYSVSWDTDIAKRSLSFGWPLMLNGVVIVIAGQFDKFLVGGLLGVETLALYAVAIMLISAPTLVATKVVGALVLPILARIQNDHAAFNEAYRIVGASVFLSALVIFIPLAFLGPPLVTVVFGQAYAVPEGLFPWLVLGFGFRFVKGWPVVASLAKGDTKNLLFVNVVRISGIAIGLLAIKMGAGIVGLAASLALGELLAFSVGVLRQNFQARRNLTEGVTLAVIFLICCGAPVFLVEYIPAVTIGVSVGMSVISVIFSVAVILIASADARSVTRKISEKVLGE